MTTKKQAQETEAELAAQRERDLAQAKQAAAGQSSAKPETEGSIAEASTTTATSGATVEPEVVKALPMEHPAIDSTPRKGLPAESSQIDFNNPTY